MCQCVVRCRCAVHCQCLAHCRCHARAYHAHVGFRGVLIRSFGASLSRTDVGPVRETIWRALRRWRAMANVSSPLRTVSYPTYTFCRFSPHRFFRMSRSARRVLHPPASRPGQSFNPPKQGQASQCRCRSAKSQAFVRSAVASRAALAVAPGQTAFLEPFNSSGLTMRAPPHPFTNGASIAGPML